MGPQRALYDITLAAQEAAIAMTKPGNTFMQPHEAALKMLTQGLLDEGLLKLSELGSLDNAIETGAYRRFYMHRTSHWLGMDVHDVGSYREATQDSLSTEKPWRILKSGMVITVEPGLYVRPADDIDEKFWNIRDSLDYLFVEVDGTKQETYLQLSMAQTMHYPLVLLLLIMVQC
jgi:Xaa-Pro aminopeptidase